MCDPFAGLAEGRRFFQYFLQTWTKVHGALRQLRRYFWMSVARNDQIRAKRFGEEHRVALPGRSTPRANGACGVRIVELRKGLRTADALPISARFS